MSQMIKRIARKLLPPKLRLIASNILSAFDVYYQRSYSQEGEDMILMNLFRGRSAGFYIDVGAHHPFIFSNTYVFYKLGWRGINIDAMPGSMRLFHKYRPNDINLELAIAKTKQTLTFYQFNEPALDTFSKELAEERARIDKFKLVSCVELSTHRLDEVLDQWLPPQQEIDFINIDVEGYDLEVVLSNDWERYRPKAVLVESIGFPLAHPETSGLFTFLTSKKYDLFAKTVNTLIFIESGYPVQIY